MYCAHRCIRQGSAQLQNPTFGSTLPGLTSKLHLTMARYTFLVQHCFSTQVLRGKKLGNIRRTTPELKLNFSPHYSSIKD